MPQGWDYHYYVYSGMIWGTRTGGSHEIIEPFFGDRQLFIDSYVASLASDRALYGQRRIPKWCPSCASTTSSAVSFPALEFS